jgi:hypothetical protein
MSKKKRQINLDTVYVPCKTLYLTMRPESDEIEDLYCLIEKHPKVAQVIVKSIKKGIITINCPFPIMCNRFPCKTLTCSNDTIENGVPRRMT